MLNIPKKPCNQCLFTENKIVSKNRADEIIKNCLNTDTYFQCHKVQTNGLEEDICCRSFWNKYKNQFNLGRIAQRLNAIKEVDLE